MTAKEGSWRHQLLNLHRLWLLHEFRLRGTVAAVATALSYSPSTVSQQLTILEREAGVGLFVPVGRRLRLTPAGEQLAGRAAELLLLHDEIRDELRNGADQVTGTVRLSVPQSTTLAVLPRVLTTLERAYPKLRVEMFRLPHDQALLELAGRRFDLVVVEEYPGAARRPQPDFDYEPLCEDALRIAMAPGRSATSLADLRSSVWVMEPPGSAAREWAVEQCRRAGFEPDVRYQTDDLCTHRLLIENGNACGVLPALFLGNRPAGMTLVDLPGRPLRQVFTTARRTSADTPALRACRDALRAAVCEAGAAHG